MTTRTQNPSEPRGRTHAAQGHFSWPSDTRAVFHPLNAARTVDTQNDGRLMRLDRFRARIERTDGSNDHSSVGEWKVTIQGNGPGSRRFSYHATLTEAQEHITRWFGRRFKTDGEAR